MQCLVNNCDDYVAEHEIAFDYYKTV